MQPQSLAATALMFAISTASTGTQVDVAVFGVAELVFTGPAVSISDDPHSVELTVCFRHAEPPAQLVTVNGFWDGNNRWIVRFSPPVAGLWVAAATKSSAPTLNGQHVGATVTATLPPASPGRWIAPAGNATEGRWWRRSGDGTYPLVVGNTMYELFASRDLPG